MANNRYLSYAPLVLVAAGFLIFKWVPGLPMWIALLFALVGTMVLYSLRRIPLGELVAGAYKGIARVAAVVAILLIISFLIAVWTKIGVVTAMVHLGISLIQPWDLPWISFLFTALLSMLLGSSVGTLSAVGPMFIGVAQVFGSPLGVVAGAAVSGALIGDRSSPISSTVYLMAGMTGTKSSDNYRYITPTLMISAGLTLLLEVFLSMHQQNSHVWPLTASIHLASAAWWWLLLPLGLFFFAILRLPLYLNFIISIVAAVLMSVLLAHVSLFSILHAAWFGTGLRIYKNSTFYAGGIWPTFDELLLVVFAAALSGVMERVGAIQAMLLDIGKFCVNEWTSSVVTVIFSLFAAGLFASQSMSVIMPAQAMNGVFDRLHLPRGKLVRLLSDSGVVVAAIIPWNLMGAMLSTAVSVRTTTYLPFAFFTYLSPVVTLGYSYLLGKIDKPSSIGESV